VRELVFAFLFTFLILSLPSLAQFSFFLSKNEIELEPDQTKRITITLKNFGEADTFNLMAWPEGWDGVSVVLDRYVVSLAQNEQKSFGLSISASKEVRPATGLIKISVRSLKTGEIQEELLVVRIKREFIVMIEDVEPDKTSYEMDDLVKCRVRVKNLGDFPEESLLKIWIEREGEIIFEEEKDIMLPPRSLRSILFEFKLERAKPGEYGVNALLIKEGKIVDRLSAKFYVEKTVKHIARKVKYEIPFFARVVIEVKNVGNAKGTFEIKETLSPFIAKFVKPEIEPVRIKREKDRVEYVWEVTLEPGETKQISYRIVYYQILIFCLIIGGAIYFAYRASFAAKIVKRSSYRGLLTPKKRITIALEIKNKSRREIKDVTIEDFVPGIIQVIAKFDTLAPKLKKSEEGVLLSWKIKRMKPDEERVLTYRVRPTIPIIGTLHLPPAKITYTIGKRKRTSKSSSVTIGELIFKI
jgi:hypothetical protein